MIKKLQDDFELRNITNDLAKRDMFWYLVLDTYKVDIGLSLWYEDEAILIASKLLPNKLRKKMSADAKRQLMRINGKSTHKQYREQDSNRSFNTTELATIWVGTISKSCRA